MNALLAIVLASTLQRFPAFNATALAIGPDKTLYSAGTYGEVKGIFRVTANGPVKVADIPADKVVYSMAALPDGSFWVVAGFDIYRVTAGEFTLAQHVSVLNLTLATDGAVWCIPRNSLQSTSGVLRFAPGGGAVSVVLPNWFVYALAPGRDGSMWFASAGAVVHVSAAGGILSETFGVGLGGLPLIASTSDGGVWAAPFFGAWIASIDGKGNRTTIWLPRGRQAAGFVAAADALYVATGDGDLLRYREGEWSVAELGGPPAPYSACDTYYDHAVAIDGSGGLWAAESLPGHGYILGSAVCEYDAPPDVRYALVRVDDAAFVSLGNRRRSAGH